MQNVLLPTCPLTCSAVEHEKRKNSNGCAAAARTTEPARLRAWAARALRRSSSPAQTLRAGTEIRSKSRRFLFLFLYHVKKQSFSPPLPSSQIGLGRGHRCAAGFPVSAPSGARLHLESLLSSRRELFRDSTFAILAFPMSHLIVFVVNN